MTNKITDQLYYELVIEAEDSQTEIWVGTDDGHFIQKDNGRLCTSLQPGKYTVEFFLGTTCYPINLIGDIILTEAQIKSGPSCQRPKVSL